MSSCATLLAMIGLVSGGGVAVLLLETCAHEPEPVACSPPGHGEWDGRSFRWRSPVRVRTRGGGHVYRYRAAAHDFSKFTLLQAARSISFADEIAPDSPIAAYSDTVEAATPERDAMRRSLLSAAAAGAGAGATTPSEGAQAAKAAAATTSAPSTPLAGPPLPTLPRQWVDKGTVFKRKRGRCVWL